MRDTSAMKTEHEQPSASNATPPNRKGFEQRIWQVNNRLAKMQEQVKNYWNEEKRTQFEALRHKLDKERHDYALVAEDELHVMQGLRETEAELHRKQREVHELEECGDLVYKTLPVAKEKLAHLESLFKEHLFTNIRDEQLWVAQMDRLQRNITRLAKYTPLVEQKRALESELREQRQRVRELRLKMRSHKDQAAELRHQLRVFQQPFRHMREALAELRAEKRELLDGYNAQKEEYRRWLREKSNKANQSAGSFPATGLLQDGDTMDLFHCQKQACKRLISYLEGLKQFGESRVEAKEKESTKKEESDSADELPEAFHKHFGLGESQKGHDKLCEDVRKLAKKQAMPLSHSLDYIRLFGEIDVHPPRTHAEVPNTIREVQRALEFYEAQTAEQPEDEDGQNDVPEWMLPSGLSSLTSPNASASLLSPASLNSPRLSFAHHPMARDQQFTSEDEPCSSSADSSMDPSKNSDGKFH